MLMIAKNKHRSQKEGVLILRGTAWRGGAPPAFVRPARAGWDFGGQAVGEDKQGCRP